jgi:hypothetical protein
MEYKKGIINGHAVKFPLLVKIKMDDGLFPSTIGDVNFNEQVKIWPLLKKIKGRNFK